MENNQNENLNKNKTLENKENDNKNKKLLVVSLLLLFIIVFIIIFTFAYAKYVTTKTGTATAEIATMICEMTVEPSEANREIINPYCIVKVQNYNESNEITQTDVNYKIEVTAKEGAVLPQYTWQEQDGTILAYDTPVTGSFTHGNKQDKTYKIIFANSGEQDITQVVDFNLVAIQGDGSEN